MNCVIEKACLRNSGHWLLEQSRVNLNVFIPQAFLTSLVFALMAHPHNHLVSSGLLILSWLILNFAAFLYEKKWSYVTTNNAGTSVLWNFLENTKVCEDKYNISNEIFIFPFCLTFL